MSVNVEEKLGIDKFRVDENNAHIYIKNDPDLAEFYKLHLACPAGLYKIDDKYGCRFDYAGCLECGTCRVVGGETVLAKWEFPNGGMGVEFRYG
ncbi:MAG: ferredoxin family protein [Gracilibacteraceae bacterium]|jgi:ferredoxin like protein|nr:ferredoxin family protein [Gracilibacteraceae bacterium]